MKKTILSLLLLPTLALSMTTNDTFSDTEIIVPRGCISSQARLGALSAVADKYGFAVVKDGQETRVHNHDVDPVLRRANKKQLLHLLKQHRLRITQFDNDDFKLALSSELKGGGILGAWAGSYLAGGLVAAGLHGTLVVIAGCTGPAAPYTFGALEFWCAPTIHGLALTAACAGGIAGGVATGPV